MRVATILGSVLLVASAGCSATPPPKSEPSKLLQRAMPAFSRESLNGTAIDTGGLNGPVVIKFFSAACEACDRTLPVTQAVYKRMPQVTVIGVSEDAAERVARKAVSKHHLRFPVIVDADNTIAKRFGLDHPPKAFVADGQGRIRWVGGEDITEDGLVAALEALPE